MEADGASKERATSALGWPLGPWLVISSPTPLKSRPRENYEKCLFRLPHRFDAADLLGSSEHAREILFSAGTLFPHHPGAHGQRISLLSGEKTDLLSCRDGLGAGLGAALRRRSA